MNKLVAVVGMCGSGKSEVCRILEKKGYFKVYFGAITLEEVKKRGLVLNEKNERIVREGFRKEHGMAAYALLNLPKINKAINESDVMIDGLYSWSEYRILKEKFPGMVVIAVYTPLKLRYKRLAERPERPITGKEIKTRDYSEIENLEKGGPIAMADYTIMNDDSIDELKKKIDSISKVI